MSCLFVLFIYYVIMKMAGVERRGSTHWTTGTVMGYTGSDTDTDTLNRTLGQLGGEWEGRG